MSRPIAVLRPDPGNRVTAAAIEARGRTAIRLPLFAARPVAWEPPDPGSYDALIVTSANAIRHGGAGLAALAALPVHAVGEVTAEAARRAGFDVASVGEAGSAELLAIAESRGIRRALHLAGRDRSVESGGIVASVVTVYASEAVAVAPEAAARLRGSIALVQSARAAARLGEVVDGAGLDRGDIAIVAIGARAALQAGPGWQRCVVPAEFRGAALIDAAIRLAD